MVPAVLDVPAQVQACSTPTVRESRRCSVDSSQRRRCAAALPRTAGGMSPLNVLRLYLPLACL